MTDPERFVAEVLERAGAQPEREGVSEAFAEERIAEKIARFHEPRQREGMTALDQTLREHEVPPGVRLHLITAVAHLSRIGEETLGERKERAGARRP